MSLLVVGSIALDTVQTPFGRVEEILGGSAIYFSLAASYLADVRVVGVVGDDFPESYIEDLRKKKIDTRGIKKLKGKTFRWSGRYDYDLNQAITIDTQLNVFAGFNPELPDDYLDSDFLFLANIHPELQLKVLNSVISPKLVACDTMNCWIENERAKLMEVLRRVNMVVINEAEARQLSEEPNIGKAAKKILSLGPQQLIIKRGEYGAMLFTRESIFVLPGYPLESVHDPTGAGDSFAGGLMGYISYCNSVEEDVLRQAIVIGNIIASYCVEDFSVRRLCNLTYEEINERLKKFKNLIEFKDVKAEKNV